jgi:hypothetical protein
VVIDVVVDGAVDLSATFVVHVDDRITLSAIRAFLASGGVPPYG